MGVSMEGCYERHQIAQGSVEGEQRAEGETRNVRRTIDEAGITAGLVYVGVEIV